MKTIQELIDRIDEIPEFSTICARAPWLPESEAALKADPEEGSNPFEKEGLEYLIEIFIAKEVLESMSDAFPRARCLRVIQYAMHDA